MRTLNPTSLIHSHSRADVLQMLFPFYGNMSWHWVMQRSLACDFSGSLFIEEVSLYSFIAHRACIWSPGLTALIKHLREFLVSLASDGKGWSLHPHPPIQCRTFVGSELCCRCFSAVLLCCICSSFPWPDTARVALSFSRPTQRMFSAISITSDIFQHQTLSSSIPVA